MSIYLKAKHWQLFIVLTGSMLVAQAMMTNSMLSGDAPNALVMAILKFIFAIVFFGWLWAIASACSKALPPELVSSTRPMLFGLVYVLISLFISDRLFLGSNDQLLGYIVFMQLLAMVSLIYALGFTAKQLAKLEHGKNLPFLSYSGLFFLFWFFPIGVWFIQPKVNQLLGNSEKDRDTHY